MDVQSPAAPGDALVFAPDELPALRVFVSSPGDVSDERRLAARVIERLGAEFAGRATVGAYLWEDEPMHLARNFQAQIPSVEDFDVVLCILWSRLGTPLEAPDGRRYGSGTEYEVASAQEARAKGGRPEVMVYRNLTHVTLRQLPPEERRRMIEQLEALDAFIEHHCVDSESGQVKGAFTTYQDLGQFETLLEKHLRKLVQARLPAAAPAAAPTLPGSSWKDRPYRRLEAFGFEHAPIFFGRTKATGEVLALARRRLSQVLDARAGRGANQETLKPAAFVLVSAMSGVGKSSLVRAGVLPLLVEPGDGVAVWRRAELRPGEAGGDLFEGLARALVRPEALPELIAGETSEAEIAGQLRRHPEALEFGLARALEHVAERARRGQEATMEERRRDLAAGGRAHDAGLLAEQLAALRAAPWRARLAVVVDQLEELFTLPGVTPAQREGFVLVLAALARSGRAVVLATLRSDLFSRCAELPVLVELAQGEGFYHLLPPTPAEIGQMIRQPALAAGLRFESDPETRTPLDETLRDAAARSPEALPLLEFCLDELYAAQEKRGDGLLRVGDYQALGGVEGALAQRAEEVFAALKSSEQEQFVHVMRGVTTVALEQENAAAFTRRWADLDELTEPSGAKGLVDAFLAPAARLFVSGEDKDGRPVVSVAHEALLLGWDRLRDWLEKNRENLLIRAQVHEDARRWRENHLEGDYLVSGALPLARAQQALREGFLDASERAFVEASTRAAGAAARRRTRQLRAVAAALALLAAGAGAGAWLGVRGQRQAEAAAQRAISAREGAEELVEFMTVELRDQLTPIGRLALMDGVNKKVADYHRRFGRDDDAPELLHRRLTFLINQGDARVAQGNLPAALQAYQEARTAAERLVSQDPANLEWQHDLSRSLEKIGDVLSTQDHLPAALLAFRESAAIRERLGRQDATNIRWQRGWVVATMKVGDVAVAQGNLPEALETFQKARSIAERLALQNSTDPRLQRDLSVCFDRIGSVLQAQGDLPGALQAFQNAHAIAARLAPKDPANAEWQEDLAASLSKVADVLVIQKELSGALQAYQESRAIYERLVRQDPANTDWKRSFMIVLSSIGEVLTAQGDFVQALQLHQEARAVAEGLARQDPANALWQRDVATQWERIGGIRWKMRAWQEAADAFDRELEIARPWLDRPEAAAEWSGIFAAAAGRRWEILNEAPPQTLATDRGQALKELRRAVEGRRKLDAAGQLNAAGKKDLAELEAVLRDARE